MRKITSIAPFLVCLLSLTGAFNLFGQPFWNDDDFSQFERSYQRYCDGSKALFPLEYNSALRLSYPLKLSQLVQFYADWQLLDPDSADHGGIIEAESGELRNVIQTDNTQEVIWDWCYFHDYTGRTTYNHHLEYAWSYVMRFPAYEEEHSASSYYYPVWNCGLGLLAEMQYRQAYGDTTYSGYADSCAQHIINNPLSFTHSEPYYRILHPMVTGFCAGALYLYGLETGNEYYRSEALEWGSLVKEWIEDYPSLHLNWSVWAMSSGTAMWGVLNSYFREYPEEAGDWISYYSRYLPEMADPATEYDPYLWDNSWNIWYANCYRTICEFLPDSVFYHRFRHIFDYLLSQDTDNDGGIPSSFMHPPEEDMTWISAYLILMGLPDILDSIPGTDAGAIEINLEYRSPLTLYDTVAVNFTIANFGKNNLDHVFLTLYADSIILLDTSISLAYGQNFSLDNPVKWVPASEEIHYIILQTSTPGDENNTNDTLTTMLEITPLGTVQGFILGTSGSGIFSEILFNICQDTTLWVYTNSYSDSFSGYFSQDLPAGYYKLHLLPQFPNVESETDSLLVSPGETTFIEIAPPVADLMLVDDDAGNNYEEYYQHAMDNLGIRYYHWDYQLRGLFPVNQLAMLNTPVAIWFTGDCSTATITEADQDTLIRAMERGFNLIITGQGIGEDLGSTGFYADFLQAEYLGNTSQFILESISGDDVSGSLRMIMLGGNGSANNQEAPDIIGPSPQAAPLFRYAGDTTGYGGLRYSNPSSGAKLVYLGFGMEGMADNPAFATREELLWAVLEWFDSYYDIPQRPSAPHYFELLSAYPNPFNSMVNLKLMVHAKSVIHYQFYDLSGKLIDSSRLFPERPGESIIKWEPDLTLPSGIYFFRAVSQDRIITQKLLLLK
ncbi:T9SS type A sorting domain-containing protein [bacterium]|nr:T9SS type A sorting domain-containing protein [bacterium]